MTSQETATLTMLTREKLTDLALDAALELDRFLKGLAADQGKVTQLASILDDTANAGSDGHGARLASDPSFVVVYGRTLSEHLNTAVSTVAQLQKFVAELSKGFREDLSKQTPETLGKLRDFCLTLHRELIADAISARLEPRTGRDRHEPSAPYSLRSA